MSGDGGRPNALAVVCAAALCAWVVLGLLAIIVNHFFG